MKPKQLRGMVPAGVIASRNEAMRSVATLWPVPLDPLAVYWLAAAVSREQNGQPNEQ